MEGKWEEKEEEEEKEMVELSFRHEQSFDYYHTVYQILVEIDRYIFFCEVVLVVRLGLD